MTINPITYNLETLTLMIRKATTSDAKELAALRQRIDAETEFLDRTPEESTLSEEAFQQIIEEDETYNNHLFLVVVVDEHIIGFSRCIAHSLKRFEHGADFGICILQNYCGKGIGRKLLDITTKWADSVGIKRIELTVVEDNVDAMRLYRQYGFVKEGMKRIHRKHGDGFYHNTIIMSRIPSQKTIERPSTHPRHSEEVQLRSIDHSNWEQCIALRVSETQGHFVATNAYSLLQAQYSEGLYPLGIYVEDTMVGFIMYEQDFKAKDMGMCRLMIDHNHQGKGYGRQAVELLLTYVEKNYPKLPFYTSFEPDNEVACHLYESLGFKDTGHTIDNEKLYQYLPDTQEQEGE